MRSWLLSISFVLRLSLFLSFFLFFFSLDHMNDDFKKRAKAEIRAEKVLLVLLVNALTEKNVCDLLIITHAEVTIIFDV